MEPAAKGAGKRPLITPPGFKRCVICRGLLPISYLRTHCPECIEHERIVRANRAERYKAEHKCRICGAELPEKYTKLTCEKCLAYRIKWKAERKERLERQMEERA